MSKLIIGSHVSLSSPNYLLGAVQDSINYGANTFMVYTGAPQNTVRRDIADFKVRAAHELMQANDIRIDNIIVHAPYIINLCSAKLSTRDLAVDFLTKELDRVNQMGFTKLVLHPGSRIDQELSVGIKQIVDGLNYVFDHSHNEVMVLLETMAGKGSEVGSNMQELQQIIAGVKNQDRVGVCLDTCHLSDAGIDITDFNQYLDQFDKVIGIDKIKCVHVNDSMNVKGSHKDRHNNLGYGHIGFDTLINIIYNPRLENVPKILETPYVEKGGDFVPPYKQEIEMIKNKKFTDWR